MWCWCFGTLILFYFIYVVFLILIIYSLVWECCRCCLHSSMVDVRCLAFWLLATSIVFIVVAMTVASCLCYVVNIPKPPRLQLNYWILLGVFLKSLVLHYSTFQFLIFHTRQCNFTIWTSFSQTVCCLI